MDSFKKEEEEEVSQNQVVNKRRKPPYFQVPPLYRQHFGAIMLERRVSCKSGHDGSKGSPEIVCVEVAGELGVDVYDVHVSLCGVANDGLVVLASSGVGFDVDAEGTVELEFQSTMSVSICA